MYTAHTAVDYCYVMWIKTNKYWESFELNTSFQAVQLQQICFCKSASKALSGALSMYRPTGKEARRQACWRKPCHTWQDISAQAWHPQSRVTACGVTVGPTQMGRPGGSQAWAGWPDPRAHPLVATPHKNDGRDHVAVSIVQTWGAVQNRSHLTGHTASRLSDTLS